ncbi:MAG: hypothetical protein QOH60_2485 [Mycobacterium sp.]|jgi:hypothetical protein|nr:hypothetical protein [Mycobacterium sp.]
MHSLQGWRKPGVQVSDRRGVSAQQASGSTLCSRIHFDARSEQFRCSDHAPGGRLSAKATNCPWAPTAANPDVSCDRLLAGCGGLIGSTPGQTVRANVGYQQCALGRHFPRRLGRDVIRRCPTANRPVWGGLPAVQAVRTGRPLALRRDIRQILGSTAQRSGPGVRSPSGWLPQLQ